MMSSLLTLHQLHGVAHSIQPQLFRAQHLVERTRHQDSKTTQLKPQMEMVPISTTGIEHNLDRLLTSLEDAYGYRLVTDFFALSPAKLR